VPVGGRTSARKKEIFVSLNVKNWRKGRYGPRNLIGEGERKIQSARGGQQL